MGMISFRQPFFKMPRGTTLTIEERAKILAYRDSGKKIREIAAKLNRNKKTICNFLKDTDNYGKNLRSGRPPIIDNRDIRAIKRLAVNKSISPSQIRLQLSLPITTRRIQQILNNDANLKYQKRLHEPKLLPRHKAKRLEFAEHHKFWEEQWKFIIFSDEKKFNLDGPDGCQKYWRDLRTERETRYSRNFQGGSLMVWAAFGYHGKSPMCFISHKMNSEKYVELLDDVLINFGEIILGDNWTFQQDNAAIHNAAITKEFLKSRNIPLMEWPAISPDLNPMENLWGILVQKLYQWSAV